MLGIFRKSTPPNRTAPRRSSQRPLRVWDPVLDRLEISRLERYFSFWDREDSYLHESVQEGLTIPLVARRPGSSRTAKASWASDDIPAVAWIELMSLGSYRQVVEEWTPLLTIRGMQIWTSHDYSRDPRSAKALSLLSAAPAAAWARDHLSIQGFKEFLAELEEPHSMTYGYRPPLAAGWNGGGLPRLVYVAHKTGIPFGRAGNVQRIALTEAKLLAFLVDEATQMFGGLSRAEVDALARK